MAHGERAPAPAQRRGRRDQLGCLGAAEADDGGFVMRLLILAMVLVVVSVISASGQTPQGANAEGEGLYTARCAKCHESGVPRAAPTSTSDRRRSWSTCRDRKSEEHTS